MSKRKWLFWIAIPAVTLIAVASAGISRALRADSVRRYLIGYLESSFGRTVDVGTFDFSILNGGRLQAHSVTVSEDPRFGHEYFLRAETLTATPRWSALIAGRFELGTLVLSRTSLNLVRDAQGRWNIELWLPPAAPIPYNALLVGAAAAPHGAPTARLSRIDIDGGRINFKQGDAKSVLALLDVSGRIEQDSNGRWDLDLEARPMRVGVHLQDIGTLRLRGNVSGTSARFQPAELNLTWRQVSVADALRLSRQVDYGIRGQLDIDITARVASAEASSKHTPARDSRVDAPAASPSGAQWAVSGTARLAGMHGWAFPGRSSDPAVMLLAEAQWTTGEARAEIGKLLIEMPGSHLQGNGVFDWRHGFEPELRFESSQVALSDALSWYRAFRAGVADGLAVDGTLGVEGSLRGWPLRVQQITVAGMGARLTIPALASPLEMSAISAKASQLGIELAATDFSFAPSSPVAPVPKKTGALHPASASAATEKSSADKFTLSGKLSSMENGTFRWPGEWSVAVEGGTAHLEDWLALLDAVGQPRAAGWTAAGGLALKMRGSRKRDAASALWLGTMDLRDLSVNPGYVNQPILLPKAHADFTQAQRTITLAGAEAFGATWRGTVWRKSAEGSWTFDVSADRLDAAELDRWLGPRARTGLLARFANLGIFPQSRPPAVSLVGPSVHGHVRVGEFILAPLRLEQFESDAEVAGRTITMRDASANFFGGKLVGRFDARLLPEPSYEFEGRFDRVDLAELGHAVPSLRDRISGIATGSLTLSAHGVGRQKLIESIDGMGALSARNAELRGLNALKGPDQAALPAPFLSHFELARGNFRIVNQGIDFQELSLESGPARFRADGRIAFSRVLNIVIRPFDSGEAPSPDRAVPEFRLSGSVDAPALSLTVPTTKIVARSGIHGN